MADRLHIMTRRPRLWKSSVIEALALQGFPHMPEAERAIIQDQMDIGANAVRGRIATCSRF